MKKNHKTIYKSHTHKQLLAWLDSSVDKEDHKHHLSWGRAATWNNEAVAYATNGYALHVEIENADSFTLDHDDFIALPKSKPHGTGPLKPDSFKQVLHDVDYTYMIDPVDLHNAALKIKAIQKSNAAYGTTSLMFVPDSHSETLSLLVYGGTDGIGHEVQTVLTVATKQPVYPSQLPVGIGVNTDYLLNAVARWGKFSVHKPAKNLSDWQNIVKQTSTYYTGKDSPLVALQIDHNIGCIQIGNQQAIAVIMGVHMGDSTGSKISRGHESRLYTLYHKWQGLPVAYTANKPVSSSIKPAPQPTVKTTDTGRRMRVKS